MDTAHLVPPCKLQLLRVCLTLLQGSIMFCCCITHLSCCSYAYLAQVWLVAVPEVHQDHDGRAFNTVQRSTAQHSTA